jgi:excisionase family DNA binding protein
MVDMPKLSRTSMTPLYVRLPADAAARLDRTAFERGTSKRELVTDAVVRLLDGETTVGRAEVRTRSDAEVLTVEQAAELLQVDADTVRTLAREGTLPGRKVGREWRFARAALLRWLGADG